MNKDINIVLNTIDYATATWLDLQVADGDVTIAEKYSFPWKKLFSAEKQAAVTAATGAITLSVPSTPVAGTEYRVIVNQFVADEEKVVSIGYVAVAGDDEEAVCDNLRTLINAFVSAGSLDVVASGTTTCIITSTTTNPLISVGGLLELTASAPTAGTAGVNEGATLLSEGVVDSFSGTLPTSGVDYTSYKLGLKVPKGHGGFNGQTSDQELTLNVYLNEAETDFGDLEDDIDALLSGNDPASANTDWAFADALAV